MVSLPPHIERVDTLTQMTPLDRELHKIAFQGADRDGNGALDRNELLLMITKQMGQEPTAEEFEMLWAGFDADQDGKVTLDEYIRVFQIYFSPAPPAPEIPLVTSHLVYCDLRLMRPEPFLQLRPRRLPALKCSRLWTPTLLGSMEVTTRTPITRCII